MIAIVTDNEEATTKSTRQATDEPEIWQEMPVYPLRCAAHTLHLVVTKCMDVFK
jgi:hypothetical protein